MFYMYFTLENTQNFFSNAILPGLSLGLANHIKKKLNQCHFIITEDTQTAERLKSELLFLLPEKLIFLFPDLDILPFDDSSASDNIIFNRLNTLYNLIHKENSIVIANINTILKYLPPVDFLNKHSFLLQVGKPLDLIQKSTEFQSNGYNYVHEVLARGEFSINNNIIDIFPMGSNKPYRINLSNNEISSIRILGTDTQCFKEKVNLIHILPTQEFILDNNTLAIFKKNWSNNLGLLLLVEQYFENYLRTLFHRSRVSRHSDRKYRSLVHQKMLV